MIHMWNYDKPHRCPECHEVWTWRVPVWEYDTLDGAIPRWWKIYTCKGCGTRFTGLLAWIPLTRIRVRSLLRLRRMSR